MSKNKLSWKVYITQGQDVKIFDIFENGYLLDSINEDLERNKVGPGSPFEEFEKSVKRTLMYHFWSRCEWEIIISDWPPSPPGKFNEEKVDVYDQISLNWDVFIHYLKDNM